MPGGLDSLTMAQGSIIGSIIRITLHLIPNNVEELDGIQYDRETLPRGTPQTTSTDTLTLPFKRTRSTVA